MRKVILVKPCSEVVEASKVTQSKFYGVACIRKGFIINKSFDLGKPHYVACVAEYTTIGDYWEDANDTTLQGLITKLLKRSFHVYEFDNHFELFKWLSE